jgi:hypothetical protein
MYLIDILRELIEDPDIDPADAHVQVVNRLIDNFELRVIEYFSKENHEA